MGRCGLQTLVLSTHRVSGCQSGLAGAFSILSVGVSCSPELFSKLFMDCRQNRCRATGGGVDCCEQVPPAPLPDRHTRQDPLLQPGASLPVRSGRSLSRPRPSLFHRSPFLQLKRSMSPPRSDTRTAVRAFLHPPPRIDPFVILPMSARAEQGPSPHRGTVSNAMWALLTPMRFSWNPRRIECLARPSLSLTSHQRV